MKVLYILCAFLTSMIFSCDEPEWDFRPSPRPTSNEIGYYVYDVQINQDVATLLSMLNARFYILGGEEFNEASMTLCSPGVTYKDSLLTDITKPFYFRGLIVCDTLEGLYNKTVLYFRSEADFRDYVVRYLYNECWKQGVDVKKLHLQAHFNYYLQMVNDEWTYPSSGKLNINADFASIRAKTNKGVSDEEVCKKLLATLHPLIIGNRNACYWNPTSCAMEWEQDPSPM